MSKKKSFSGSTMTLKDFHGGSIPSDLPLPSAPGVIVRSSDRSAFDRQGPASAWGNPIGRNDHRSRPGSAGATRSFDEKAAFLSHPPHIGRNFDEDERKPFDGGVSAFSRRSVREDDSGVARPPSSRGRSDPNPKSDSGKAAPSAAWQASAPATTPRSPVSVVKPVMAASVQAPSGNGGQAVVANSAPNAWGTRREVVEPPPSLLTLTGPSAVSKFAQASALEKISSGRWQTRPVLPSVNHHVPDVEVITYSEQENGDPHLSGDQVDGRVEYDGAHRRYGEGGGRDYSDNERGSSTFYSDGIRPASTEGKFCGYSQSQFQVPTEASERPKLKLLPRTKPLESLETHVGDYKQVYQTPADSGRVEAVSEIHVDVIPPKPGSAGGDGANWDSTERPKLNLKPRSQPLERLDSSSETKRSTLFGGARPRELVLRERGIDEVMINNLDLNQPANRVKQDAPKEADTRVEANVPNTRFGERPENFPPEQRVLRGFDRKDQRPDTEKMDLQRGPRKNENKRNSRDFEKPHERRQEPESWRRPMEPPKQALPEATPGQRYGKTASALELAQAFSRSVSDSKTADRFTNQRNLPGRNQVPFSRLTDTREFYSGPTPRQINGY